MPLKGATKKCCTGAPLQLNSGLLIVPVSGRARRRTGQGRLHGAVMVPQCGRGSALSDLGHGCSDP